MLREGNLLMLNRVTLEVADACSGLRSLVALVSVTAVCAAFFSMSPRRVAFLMAAAVPVAIVGNGLRVAATGLLSTWIGEAAARGFLHDLTGYAAFVAMCAIIVGLQIAAKRATRRRDGEGLIMRPSIRHGVLALAFLATYGFTHAVAPVAPSVPPAIAALPMTLAPWSGVDGAAARAGDRQGARRRRVRPPLVLTRTLRSRPTNSREAVEMDISYYAQPRVGANMHSPLNCLPGNGWQITQDGHGDARRAAAACSVRALTVGARAAPLCDGLLVSEPGPRDHRRGVDAIPPAGRRAATAADRRRRRPRHGADHAAPPPAESAVLAFAARLVPELTKVLRGV